MDKIIYGIEKGVFIVDTKNYEWLNQYKWRDHPDGYAQCWVETKFISMHRLIMNDPEGFMIDHINGLVNDNRLVNLRLSNASLNQANKRKSKNKSTKYKGVTKRRSGYETTIKKDGQYFYLGLFTDIIAAANCYNHHAQLLFGEHSRINDVEFLNEEEWSSNKAEQKLYSDFKGVHRHKNDNSWRVRFSVEGKEKVFGYYTDEVVAANVYNYHIKLIRGDKALLNIVDYVAPEEFNKYRARRNKHSLYIGVSKTNNNSPKGKAWRVRIYHDKKQYVIGLYDSELEAALAYNEYVIKTGLDRELNTIPEENII